MDKNKHRRRNCRRLVIKAPSGFAFSAKPDGIWKGAACKEAFGSLLIPDEEHEQKIRFYKMPFSAGSSPADWRGTSRKKGTASNYSRRRNCLFYDSAKA
jgi:hypothetical protein